MLLAVALVGQILLLLLAPPPQKGPNYNSFEKEAGRFMPSDSFDGWF